ncbi:single-stranded DNA binding protein [Natronolimnohabitans sp. A-GB9]|uniref:single-stranded DNA binding protein n=1 Tax=Natronolimnohabitans sp. A-GB9 TaxID=3069757 RepID=UPI0027B6F155|nr:single-stranded DNA binding protein [Natronolimnohabitans sp. A-GB9]MDQ2052341.1 single-stranded DNA binding protein [Natronolimnohabitans sp. A-GB9]
MSDIEGVYEDLEADVSLEEFREAVEAKVEQMGGLADEETAAMLVAHEIGESEVGGIADIEPGMEEAKFVAKVISIGEVRTFERDGEDEDGRVVNVEVADETGSVRAAFWDEHAEAAIEELEEGQVLRIKGRPKEGYSGVEVSVDEVEPDQDTEIDAVEAADTHTVEDLSLGLSNVNLVGLVLDTDSVRTFDRDDGSEGKVSNLVLGDSTGRVRVTLWDEQADLATEIEPGTTVEVVDGYVKERDGTIELHVGNRGAVEEVDEEVEYVPESTPIEDLEIGQTVDIAGVVRSADPKRTFDRDDGSEGQVRNIRVQDATGDIRVALWGEKADIDVGPGDEVALGDVEIQDGWQDDLEASAGWQSTVTVLESDSAGAGSADGDEGGADNAGLSAFSDDGSSDTATASDSTADSDAGADDTVATAADTGADEPADGEELEFTGVVVQAGNPVVLDDGETTMSVATDVDVGLGEEVTARGVVRDGRLEANDVF